MSTGTYDGYLYYEVSGTYIKITGGANTNRVLVIPPTIVHSGISYNVEEISENAFAGQSWTGFDASNSNLITIGDQAIRDCHSIQSIDLNNSRQLINIGSYAFYNDYNASSLNLQDCISLQEIKALAFYACFGITSANFTRCYSLRSLGYSCFGTTSGNPGSITSINFQDSPFVDFSNNLVFDNQQQLTSVTFGGNAPSIIPITGSNTSFTNFYAYNWSNFDTSFGGYPVTYIYSSFNDLSYDLIDFSYITITGGEPSGTLTIPPNITHAGLEYNVQEISGNAFLNNGDIIALDASNSNLITIRNKAFFNAVNIATIDFSGSNDLIEIETNAFQAVFNVSSINFTGCSSLTIIGDSSLGNGSPNPNNYNKVLTSLDFTDCYKLSIIGNFAFENDVSLSSITFGSLNPPLLGAGVFYNIDPSAVIYVNWWSNFELTFSTNPSLPVVKIYNDISYNINYNIVDGSYVDIISYNSKLETALGNEYILNGALEIPDSIDGYPVKNLLPTQNGELGTFQDLENITSISLPQSIETIMGYTFRYLNVTSNITQINFQNLINLKTIGWGSFSNNVNLVSVDLSGCISLELIDTWAFNDCINLTTINLTGCNSLTTIKREVFGNTNLQTIVIPSSVTLIESNTFNGCNNLETIDLGNCSSMTTIVDNNYQNLPSLTNIILNASLQTIGQNAFSNCSNLININLGICTNLTSIGQNAFENCTSLQTIDLTNLTNLTTFSNSVFKNSGIQSIILPTSLNQQGETTFENCQNLNSITYLGPCPSDLNTNGSSLSTTPFKDLSGNAKIYVYYEYSSTNPDNTGPGPYYLTEYQRASTIPVVIINPPPPPPPPSKHCCPKPAIIDKRQYIYQNGQNASKLFTRINSARRSRNKYSIPISQSNITNICDTNLNLMINTNVSVSYSGYQQHIDNINRLNNSKNCQILGLKFPHRLAISSLF